MATNTKARRRRLPKIGRHSSGQARVTICGKVHYLGAWGSPEAHAKYAALIQAWEQNGRRPLHETITVVEARFTLRDLFARYREYLDDTGRYTKHGRKTSQRTLIERALSEIEATFGDVVVHRFSETHLLQHRDELERNLRLTRSGINRKVSLILQAFGWGRRRGFVPKAVWLDLKAVEPLSRVECGNRPEGIPKRIPTLDELAKVLPHCSRQVAAMLRLQVLTGMRPGGRARRSWTPF